MRVSSDWTSGWLELRFEAEDTDQVDGPKARLAGTTARVALPEGIGAGDVHADLEALAALLVAQPFTRSLNMRRPVSAPFAEAVRTALGCSVWPIATDLAPRTATAGARQALVFNGSIESFAALAVLPEATVPVFLRRILPPGGEAVGSYRDDVAVHACEQLAARGREVRVVESDLEHLRDPLGFATDWTSGVPAVVLADHLAIDGIAWPIVAEDAYRIGRDAYADWAKRRRAWATVLEAAGLSFLSPLAGVSEVGAAMIVHRGPDAALASACLRGRVGRPCGRCWKCFKHTFVEAALTSAWPGRDEIDRFFRVPEVARNLGAAPIHHEDVIAWWAARYPGRHPLVDLLKERTGAGRLSLDWLERWYGPSEALLPDGLREPVAAAIDARLDRMTPLAEERFRAWDLSAHLAAKATGRARTQLARAVAGEGPAEAGRGRLSRLFGG